MPSSHGWNDRLVAEAVRTGALDESDLDRSVARVLRLVSRHHRETPEEHLDLGAHHELAREAASRSAVLLKNERAALPLPGLGDVVVIGEMARTPRYQGAGSSQVNPTRLDNALDALRRRHPGLPFEPGYPLPDSPAAAFPAGELLRRAQEAAAGRTVLLFLGLPAADESEGYDRQHISLPAGHVDLLRAVRRVANGVIVLLSNGAAVATASCGPIAFVAFMSGPIAARISRSASSLVLPASLVGAILVLASDLIGQFAFGARYPVGIITGALGAPFLVYLLIRSNRQRRN